jgi:parallel beta-helix repeat protein
MKDAPRISRACLVLAFLALLALLSVLAFASEDSSARTYTVPDNYPTIQVAVDNAADGDTIIVRGGLYNEKVTIRKSINLEGSAQGTTLIRWEKEGAILTLTAPQITIRDIDIEGNTDAIGILAHSSVGCRFVGVKISDCQYGIFIEDGSSLVLERCTITDCWNTGLYVSGSSTQIFESLRISSSHFNGNNGAGIFLGLCKLVEIDDISVSNNKAWGITIYQVSHAHLRNSTMKTNVIGLRLIRSHGWAVEDNVVSNNLRDGIELNNSGAEHRNVFRRNQILDNSVEEDTSYAGIALLGPSSSKNLFEQNVIVGNPICVNLDDGSDACRKNTFLMNEFREYAYAIWEHPGAGPNTFLLNMFLDSGGQAADLHPSSNFDDGRLGNFWKDYLEKYPNAGEDGPVWSIPYRVIAGDFIVDRFPLRFPREEDPPEVDLGLNLEVTFGIAYYFPIVTKDASSIASYEWTITDPDGYETTRTTTGPKFYYTFRSIGRFWISVKVTDYWGLSATDTVQYTVVDDLPPVADAGDDIAVDLGTEFTLDATGSTDNQAIALTHWVVDPGGLHLDFYEPVATLSIDALGTYSAILFIVDYSGNSAMDGIYIKIQDLSPPNAVARGDATVSTGEEVAYDGSGSTDNVGIVSYKWTIMKGGYVLVLEGPTISYIFQEVGDYILDLQVFDIAGHNDIARLEVKALDTAAPVARAGRDVDIPMGAKVNFDGSGSTDNTWVSRYTWTFAYRKETIVLEGWTTLWTFREPGEYKVTLMVFDEAGNIDTDVMTVTVQDTGPPEASFWSPNEVKLGTCMTLDASGSEDNVGVVQYEWTVTHKANPNTLFGPMVTYPLNEPGSYRIVLTVRDAAGNEDTEERTLYVPPLSTEAEMPGWLVPVMVMMVSAAVLLGYAYGWRRFGSERG